MQALEAINTAMSVAPVGGIAAANLTARENGMAAAVVLPPRLLLPVHAGRFQDFGDPTRYGSRCELPASFRRGYHPILKLNWNEGPLSEAAARYRGWMAVAVLIDGGGVYDWKLDAVYRDWFGYASIAMPHPKVYGNYAEAKAHAPLISQTSYVYVTVTTVPMNSLAPPSLDDLLGGALAERGEARASGDVGAIGMRHTSGLVAESDARPKSHDGWYDPPDVPAEGDLRSIRLGTWQVGDAATEQVTVTGMHMYRHVLKAMMFQTATERLGKPPSVPVNQRATPLSDASEAALPHPYVLDGVQEEKDIAGLRAKTTEFTVVWQDAGVVVGRSVFRPDGETHWPTRKPRSTTERVGTSSPRIGVCASSRRRF